MLYFEIPGYRINYTIKDFDELIQGTPTQTCIVGML